MSEKTPSSNPFGEALDTFDAKKEAHDGKAWIDEIQGEAGKTDFSEEARQRLKDLKAYHAHMEGLSQEERSDYDRGLDRLESGEEESAAYGREWDAAKAENEARDAAKAAQDEALEVKFAENANLRQMDAISKELHELGNKVPTDADSANRDIRRHDELEDRLQELLVRYSESEDYDPAIADMMMDRDDAGALRRAAERALSEREGRDVAEKEKNFVTDPEEARALADAEAIARYAESHPEVLDDPEFVAKLRKIVGDLDTALASAKAGDSLEAPKDGSDLDTSEGDELTSPEGGDDLDTGEDDELEAPKGASDLDDGEEELTPPKDGSDLDTGDDGEPTPPADGDDLRTDEPTDGEADTGERVSRWRRPDLAIYAYFASGRGLERFRSSNKSKVAAVIGGIAIIGGLIAARHYGWFGGGGGNGDAAQNFTPGQKGGHPGGPGIETPPPTPKVGPELPNAGNYAHPWNWMTAAIENGSVKPPAGMSAEQALHHYGDLAAKAGHKVEWYNLPNGLEAVRIDNSDDTEAVAKVIGQFAK